MTERAASSAVGTVESASTRHGTVFSRAGDTRVATKRTTDALQTALSRGVPIVSAGAAREEGEGKASGEMPVESLLGAAATITSTVPREERKAADNVMRRWSSAARLSVGGIADSIASESPLSPPRGR